MCMYWSLTAPVAGNVCDLHTESENAISFAGEIIIVQVLNSAGEFGWRYTRESQSSFIRLSRTIFGS
jgi:hypothetical protein